MKVLSVAIGDYLLAADAAMAELKEVMGLGKISLWRERGFSRSGRIGGVAYEFHGSGVFIEREGCLEVDVEFSSPDCWEGFDSWRLWQWMRINPGRYSGFSNHEDVRNGLAEMFEAGHLVAIRGSHLYKLILPEQAICR